MIGSHVNLDTNRLHSFLYSRQTLINRGYTAWCLHVSAIHLARTTLFSSSVFKSLANCTHECTLINNIYISYYNPALTNARVVELKLFVFKFLTMFTLKTAWSEPCMMKSDHLNHLSFEGHVGPGAS